MDCAALLSLFLPLATALPPPADLSAPSFRRLAAAGTATNRWIELRGRTFSLRDEFSIPTGRALRIRGPGHIIGDSHSLFKLAGRSCLECETGVRLSHRASPQRAHRRELGAAVFALGKSHVLLRNVSITSERGFGVWMVQRARVELMDGSDLHHCGRSAIVAFGTAEVYQIGDFTTAFVGAGTFAERTCTACALAATASCCFGGRGSRSVGCAGATPTTMPPSSSNTARSQPMGVRSPRRWRTAWRGGRRQRSKWRR